MLVLSAEHLGCSRQSVRGAEDALSALLRPPLRHRRRCVYACASASPDGFCEAGVASIQHTAQGSVIYLRLKSACAGTRAMLLPLYVGDVEAKALESHLMRALPSRPLTHDLASSLLRSVGCRCASARVTHIKANTYYATLEVAPPEGSFFFVDSRPSDALNMAVRLGAPIYISEELMRTHGVSEEEGGAPRLPSLPPVAQTAPVSKRLDGTLELRMRIALAVAQGRSADAQKLREEVEEALAKGPHALGSYGGRSLAELAGRAMVDLELAVKEERWADAAAAGATLAALDEELGPRSG